MTEDSKSSLYWTVGTVVALAVIVGAMWMLGYFDAAHIAAE